MVRQTSNPVNSAQLFSQNDTQTQTDNEDLRKAAIKKALEDAQKMGREARKGQQGRRVTFSEFVDYEDDDTTQLDVVADSAELAHAVQTNPEYVYNLVGQMMEHSRVIAAKKDALEKANNINLTELQETWDKLNDALSSKVHPGKIAQLTRELQQKTESINKAKEERDSYRKGYREAMENTRSLKSKLEDVTAQQGNLNNELADLAEKEEEIKALKEKVTQLEQQTRGRSRERKDTNNTTRSSILRKLLAMRKGEKGSRGASRSRTPPRSRTPHSRRRQPSKDNTPLTPMSSTATVNLTLSTAIKSDRGVHGPREPFDGTDRTKFFPWYQTIMTKLSVTEFRTINDALSFVHSFTSGQAWNLLNGRVPKAGPLGRSVSNPFTDVDEMLTYLAERYTDRDMETKAFKQSVSMKQEANESFTTYYARYSIPASFIKWGSEAQEVETLHGGLNARFKKAILGRKRATLSELVNALHDVEDDMHDLDVSHPQQRAQTGKKGNGGFNNKGTPGNSGNIDKSTYPPSHRNLAPLNSDERQRCMREGRCLTCREKGHRRHEHN